MSFPAELLCQDSTSNFSVGIATRNLGAQITAFEEQRKPLLLDVPVGISKNRKHFFFTSALHCGS